MSSYVEVNPKSLFRILDDNPNLKGVVVKPLPSGLIDIFPGVRAMSKLHLDSLIDLKNILENKGLLDEAWDDSFCSMAGTFNIQAPNFFNGKEEFSDDYYEKSSNMIESIIDYYKFDRESKVRIPLSSSSGAPYFYNGDKKKIALHMHADDIIKGKMPLIGYPGHDYIVVGGRNSRQKPEKVRQGIGPKGIFDYTCYIGLYKGMKIGTGRMRPVNNYSSQGQLGWACYVSCIHHIFTKPAYKAYEPDEITRIFEAKGIIGGFKIDIKQFDSTLSEKQISSVLRGMCVKTNIDYNEVLKFFKFPQIFKKSAQEKGKFWVSGDLNNFTSPWKGNTSGIRGTTEINCFCVDCFVIFPLLESIGISFSVENYIRSIELQNLKDAGGKFVEVYVIRTGDDVCFLYTENSKSLFKNFESNLRNFKHFSLDIEVLGKGGQIFLLDPITGKLRSYLNPKSFYGNRLFIEKRLDSFHTKYKVLIGFKILKESYRNLWNAERHFSILDSWCLKWFGKTLQDMSIEQSLIQDMPSTDLYDGNSEYIEDVQALFWKNISPSLIERYGTDHITFLDTNLSTKIQNLIIKD